MKITALKTVLNKIKGFTLIELMVVIAIIGIMASIGAVTFAGAQSKGRDAKRKADLDDLKKALQLYYTDNQVFPPSATWTTAVGTYMKLIPQDPKTKVNYSYTYNSDNSYTLCAGEENSNAANNYPGCTAGTGLFPYGVGQ